MSSEKYSALAYGVGYRHEFLHIRIPRPVVAMMPDATLACRKANGIINFMGGLGSVAAFLVGGTVKQGEAFPFFLPPPLLALFVLMAAYKEPEVPCSSDDESVVSSSALACFFQNSHPPLYKSTSL